MPIREFLKKGLSKLLSYQLHVTVHRYIVIVRMDTRYTNLVKSLIKLTIKKMLESYNDSYSACESDASNLQTLMLDSFKV